MSKRRKALRKTKPVVFFLFLILGYSCSNQIESEELSDMDKVKTMIDTTTQEVRYNNQYLKITDKTGNEQPVRAIKGNASLVLGYINYKLNDEEVNLTNFQQAGTSMHLSDQGLKLSVKTLNGFKAYISIIHSDVMSLTHGEFNQEQVEINVTSEEGQMYILQKGKINLKAINIKKGTVDLLASGEFTDMENNPQNMSFELNMKFEEKTSTVGIEKLK